ncbi:hypothetical protein [Streptomyces sp. NPDC008139]|uniref:hypothetical protein n=1 Tax=Streptomyces sp. NPDC008139 TaxID=3364814 RepID=UPI0036E3E76C
MNVKFAKRAAIVVGTATLGVTIVAGTAQADPAAGVHRTLVAVGSDTTQDVLNGLGNKIADPNPTGSSDGNLIASYDATGSSTISTRDTTCASVTRPDGSGAGVNALRADIAAGSHCIDFARSSSTPNATGQFTFIPFAVDAVTAATATTTNLPANFTYLAGGSSLTNAQKATSDLTRVYNCLDTAGNPLPAGTYPTIGGVTVHPLVPQAGSGTRKFWASTLGFNATTLPSCVKDTAANGAAVQEHNGSALQGPNDLMPFSIAQHIAQGRSLPGVTDRRNGAVLKTVNSTAPLNASGNLNTAFPVTREVYNVIPDSRVTGETLIKNTFVGSASKVCTAKYDSTTTVINKYGFGTDANCGNATTLVSRDLV